MKRIIPILIIAAMLASNGMISASAKTVPAPAAKETLSKATPNMINGGTTGIFSRQQLSFIGFDGIQAEVTLPYVSLGEKGDCPYLYFGFDWKNDVGNAEGGFQFIEDKNHPDYNKWTVFIRQGNEWKWGNQIALEQGSIHHLKFYREKVTDNQSDLVIELDGNEVIRKRSAANDFESCSVKAVTAMAMSKPFDGSNCVSRISHSKIANIQVSTLKSGDQYMDFGEFDLYKEWKPEIGTAGMWFGTAECIPSYLHKASDGTISIYKEEAGEKAFKVVGYYSGDLFDEPIDQLQTDKMTHIVYAFLIPDGDGNLVALKKPDQLKAIVSKAHRDGAKVYIALGGWSYQGKPLVTVFESLAASEEKRARLIRNISLLIKEYNLDGLELDWEHPTKDSISNYERLVIELKRALDQDGKDLTAALNGAWSTTAGPEVSKLMTDTCLNSFHFINVMAYDMNNGEHSPLWFGETSINYWRNRGVPSDKIVLGMPLYARPSWKQYRHIVEEDPEQAYADYMNTSPLESHYNGINTLREKTIIAMKKAGGVMLFDVNEDTHDQTSILSMVHELQSRVGERDKGDLAGHITVILNKRELVFWEKEGYGVPFIDENNRTMIPLRKSLEAIGAQVQYDEEQRQVSILKDDITVSLKIGEKRIFVNGKEEPLDTMAVIREGRIYIPLRGVFTAFHYDFVWHGSSNTVYLNP